MKSFLFQLRRLITRTFRLWCETCQDGNIQMQWWMNVCPGCGRRFQSPVVEGLLIPSPNGINLRTWHEFLPPLNDVEWNMVKMELEANDNGRLD
jgi:hypothetical protein